MSPLCLPQPGEEVEAGQEITVLGWGKDSDSSGGVSSVLQYLQVEAVSNEDCDAVYGVITEGNGCIQGPSTCNVISVKNRVGMTCKVLKGRHLLLVACCSYFLSICLGVAQSC